MQLAGQHTRKPRLRSLLLGETALYPKLQLGDSDEEEGEGEEEGEEEEEEERGEEEVEKVRFCFCGQYEGDFIVRCSDCGRWCHETCAAEEEVTLAHPLTLTYPKPEPEPEP